MNREINFFTIAINILVEMWQQFNRFQIIIGFVGNEHMPWRMAEKKVQILTTIFPANCPDGWQSILVTYIGTFLFNWMCRTGRLAFKRADSNVKLQPSGIFPGNNEQIHLGIIDTKATGVFIPILQSNQAAHLFWRQLAQLFNVPRCDCNLLLYDLPSCYSPFLLLLYDRLRFLFC